MSEHGPGWRATLAAAAIALVACENRAPSSALEIERVLGAPAVEPGYARATAPRTFDFPADHAAHPDFRHEWWYFTGHLRDASGRAFGFQLTLFRFALAPAASSSISAWRTRDVMLGHFALSDLAGGRFRAHERRARAALGLAGYASDPVAVWVGDWRIELVDSAEGRWRLHAREGTLALTLDVSPRKPPVLPGQAGLSQKSATPGNATYYYAVSRLEAAGTIVLDDRELAVEGTAWLDREWGTSALGADQAGWDWFALQLADGTEVTYYQLRRRDGMPDPHSQGLYVAEDGSTRRLRPAPASPDAETLQLSVTGRWRSPETHIDYPAGWRLRLPAQSLELDIEPLLAGQEWNESFRYWEGAVSVRGTRAGRAVAGRGYVELTGYER